MPTRSACCTGQAASYGGSEEYDTASIVKVDILSTLLYQAQQQGSQLSAAEQELATTMIENSDNDAASDLYYDAGASSGIDTANQAFGLTETTIGTDGYWGLTNTTVDDQIRLLRLVFTAPSKLSPQSRAYIQGLMANVESDQQWGVPAAADSGTSFEVKNGWLPNPTLWEINSIGRVTHDGQRMLIAVLSSDNETEDGGISLVQDLAVKAAGALGGERVGGDLAPLGAVDFSSYLIKAQAANPDVIVFLVQGDDMLNAMKQAVQFGLQNKVHLAGAQQVVDRTRSAPPARCRRVAEGLAEPAAFGMRREPERGDDRVGRGLAHAGVGSRGTVSCIDLRFENSSNQAARLRRRPRHSSLA